MACETTLKPRQTIQQRAEEVRAVVARVAADLAAGKIKPVIGSTGGITFDGLKPADRDGVTDACIYRRIMASGSALAKAAITRQEQISGRTVNRQAIAQGLHSHDGGRSWHHGH